MQSSRLMRTLARASVGATFAVALTLTACGGSSSGAGSKGTIKVCSELPTSQKDATSGKPAENGVALAIKQANDKNMIPGYTIVHVKYDDVGAGGSHDPTVGANNIRTAIGLADIAGCVGPFNSSVAQAEMPIANQAPLALISPSNTNETLTKPQFGKTADYRPTGKVTYFRVCTTDDIQGPAMADYYIDQLHAKSVFIIDDTETYGKGIADNFAARFVAKGGKVLGRVGQDKSVTDFKPVLSQAAALHPDAIYYGGTDSTIGIPLRTQMVQVPGLESTPFGGGDGIQTDGFKSGTGAAGVGSLATVAAVNADTLDSAKQFKTDFQAMFPNAADYGAYSANAFDATNILLTAIKTAIDGGATPAKDASDTDVGKAFRQAVIDQIAKTDYNGVIGHTTFDSNGDTTNRWISVYQLSSSDWTFKYQLQFQG